MSPPRGSLLLLITAAAAAAALVIVEARTSWVQAHLLADYASEIDYEPAPGPSSEIRFPAPGPFDRRRGYSRIPDMVDRLESRNFEVAAQARISSRLARLVDFGLFPVYREKARAGLVLRDRVRRPVDATLFPERVYPEFDSIPEPVVGALLFIENRELLDPGSPYRNPAVEWDRLAGSVGDYALRALGSDRSVAGASTLATQMEKFRHSPGGLTGSPSEKLRQMASASLRSYLGGPSTLDTRRDIVLQYLNSVPLAAVGGYGEVIGLGDGLRAWCDLEFGEVNALLRDEAADPAARGAAFRAVLSLLVAHRRPSFYLGREEGRAALRGLVDTHLRLLERGGVVTPELVRSALAAEVDVRPRTPPRPAVPFVERKAENALRTHLLDLLGVPSLYELDRYDLWVRATVDAPAQDSASALLRGLEDPAFVRAAGLDGFRLLGQGDARNVVYSFVLYERRPEGNAVRVQTDNFDGPFDLNQAARLELGSTAKLRTLVSYLESVEGLHRELTALEPDGRSALLEERPDPLTRWAVEHLARRPQASLREVLDAAMERRYSASPAERFFTGGGSHVFQNFDRTYDGAVITVREGFRHSVNLVFVRIMRDVVRHHMYRIPGSSARILDDPGDPRRQEYLERFADREGRQFVQRFHRKHAGRGAGAMLDLLVDGRRLTPQRLAWVYRSVRPEAGADSLAAFLRAHSPGSAFSEPAVADLHRRADPGPLSWADLGYLARVHPLELWTVRYLADHPEAGLAEVLERSEPVRRDVYRWLFSAGRRSAQDQRIRTMLEVEAFLEIQRGWKRLGYPFDNLVPSYGTAIGSSGDRPAALAELVGILLDEGIRKPVVRIDRLRFAPGTPFETLVRRRPDPGERVLSADVAAVARAALLDVVENGTARAVHGVFRDAEGRPLAVGGKTGTGNNQYKVFGRGGRLVEARTVNRTATFAFFAGDRFFGVVTAHVPGAAADAYRFTSALPVRILALLAPRLTPLVAGGAGPSAD